MQNYPKAKQSTVVVTVVNLLAVFFAIIFMFPVIDNTRYQENLAAVALSELPKPVFHEADPFTNLLLEATAVEVYDISQQKILYSKNANKKLPLASVTKVMTALVSSEIPDDTTMEVSTSSLSVGAGGLVQNEVWKLKTLRDYTLVVSSNSGANVIAENTGAYLRRDTLGTENNVVYFVKKMNDKAHEIGMFQTSYRNPSGLDENETVSGGYGSVEDMVTLYSYILKNKPSLLSATTLDTVDYLSEDGVNHHGLNTNTVARKVPGLIASKTGYTTLANGNLVIAFNVGPMHPVIISVLGSSQEGRFIDVQKLVDASIAKINQAQ